MGNGMDSRAGFDRRPVEFRKLSRLTRQAGMLVADSLGSWPAPCPPVRPKPYRIRLLIPCPHSSPHIKAGWTVYHQALPKCRSKAVVCGAKVKGPQIRYVCRECGATSLKHYGRCSECQAWDTYDKEEINVKATTGGGVGVDAMQRAAAEARQLLTRSALAVQRDAPDYYDDHPEAAPQPTNRSWVSSGLGNNSMPMSLRDLSKSARVSSAPGRMVLTGRTGQEINRVLGGGVVRGSLVLVGGEPGVGKSTLSLQIAAMIAQPDLDYDALAETDDQLTTTNNSNNVISVPSTSSSAVPQANGVQLMASGKRAPKAKLRQGSKGTDTPSPEPSSSPPSSKSNATPSPPSTSDPAHGSPPPGPQEALPSTAARPVLYVSGEETCEQVYDRALRMGLHHCDTLHVLAECRMEVVLRQALLMRPAAIVVDSLQTMFLSDLNNVSGAVVQLKECCSGLLRLAKDNGITVFAIGHVTKSSDLAGPKAMEHMVDAVLKLEGDKSQSYRLLRAGKNRFGTTDEVGVFCMDEGGLHAVSNPSAMFMANRSSGSSAVAVVLDGTRVLVLEVQALVTTCYPGSTSPPVRQASGAPKDRVFAIIINVLHKFVARMSNQNVVVNVTGGMQMREPAGDLAIAVAIAASYYNLPVPKDIAAIGEIDLGGGLRPVRALDMRLAELAKLGLKQIVIPNVPEVSKLQRDPRLAGTTLHPCSTLLEALQVVLGPEVGRTRGKGKGEGKQQRAQAQASHDDEEDEEEEEEED